ncbi:MAG: lipase chaperone [Marinobacter sp.]|nr:lipase chaperone [Marinobacter sp.]
MKRLVIATTISALALVVVFQWSTHNPQPTLNPVQADEQPRTAVQAADPQPASVQQHAQSRAGDQASAWDETSMSQWERDQIDRLMWHERLDQYRNPGGNLQQFFQVLRSQCNQDRALCSMLLDDMLTDYPDAAFANQLQQILENLWVYDQAVEALVMSTDITPESRYHRVDELRRAHLGDQATELLFGQERAWARYQFGFEHLLTEAPNLTQQQRLAALDRLQQQRWGPYQQPLAEQQTAYGRYERELMLSLAGVSDAAERAALTAQIRARHFDPETATWMAQRDGAVEAQQSQRETYQAAVQALRQEMEQQRDAWPADVWEQRYQQRLTQLRQDIFSP